MQSWKINKNCKLEKKTATKCETHKLQNYTKINYINCCICIYECVRGAYVVI